MSSHAPVTIDELLPALIAAVQEEREYEVLLEEWSSNTWALEPGEAEGLRPLKPRGPVLTSSAMLDIVNEIIRMRKLLAT